MNFAMTKCHELCNVFFRIFRNNNRFKKIFIGHIPNESRFHKFVLHKQLTPIPWQTPYKFKTCSQIETSFDVENILKFRSFFEIGQIYFQAWFIIIFILFFESTRVNTNIFGKEWGFTFWAGKQFFKCLYQTHRAWQAESSGFATTTK